MFRLSWEYRLQAELSILEVHKGSELEACLVHIESSVLQSILADTQGDERPDIGPEGLFFDLGLLGDELGLLVEEGDAVSAHGAQQVLVYVFISKGARVQRGKFEQVGIQVQLELRRLGKMESVLSRCLWSLKRLGWRVSVVARLVIVSLGSSWSMDGVWLLRLNADGELVVPLHLNWKVGMAIVM